MFAKTLLFIVSFCSFSVFAIPQWVNTPPSPSGYLIGIGLGEDVSSSKQAAIADIAMALNSNVSSAVSSTANTSGMNGSFDTSSSHSVVSDDVLLPQIRWDNVAAENGIVYTMAKVRIADVIDLYESHLNIALKPFNNILVKQQIDLNDYLFLLANQQSLALSATRAGAISSLSAAAADYHQNIETLYSKKNEFIGSTCFNVKKSNDRMADKIYLPSIESAIQSSRFKLKSGNDCIPVKFRAKTERTGKTVANVTMQIHIGQPATVSKVIKFKGQSSGSYKSAMMDAADNFTNYFVDDKTLIASLLNDSGNTIEIGL